MQIDTWKIIGESFHFGRHGIGQEQSAARFASDSLFAALVSRLVLRESAQAVEGRTQPFLDGEPPFVISSTFPIVGNVRFLPLPLSLRSADGTGLPTKEIKRIEYVSEALFLALIAGERLSAHYETSLKLQDGSLLVSPGELNQLPRPLRRPGAAVWVIDRRPRVTLGRTDQRSTLFFTGLVSFAPRCGLWFGVRWLDRAGEWPELFEALLQDLADAGLGGERSAGFGSCQIKPGGQMDLPEAGDQAWVSLSRYLPRPDEAQALAHPQAAYRVEHVGGWLESPGHPAQRRRSLNFLAEGSVIGPVGRQVPGQVVDVMPKYPTNPNPLDHQVLRCGLALAVGIKEGAA